MLPIFRTTESCTNFGRTSEEYRIPRISAEIRPSKYGRIMYKVCRCHHLPNYGTGSPQTLHKLRYRILTKLRVTRVMYKPRPNFVRILPTPNIDRTSYPNYYRIFLEVRYRYVLYKLLSKSCTYMIRTSSILCTIFATPNFDRILHPPNPKIDRTSYEYCTTHSPKFGEVRTSYHIHPELRPNF